MLSVLELDTLITTTHLSSELSRVNWSNVSDNDKEVLITQATSFINSLRFKGKYKENGQENAFPRVIASNVIDVNDNIKRGLVCVVYDLLSNSTNSRKQMQKDGVKSISTSGVSESYVDDVSEVSDNYKKYLGKYLFLGIL